MCLSADWAGALVPLNSCHSVFDLRLASFLRGCLVGLLSFGCCPFSLSLFGWCAGACVFRPVICLGLLCLSLCVGCCLVSVRSLWCSLVLRVCVGLWLLLFFPSSVALRVFAFVVWGCFGLARSLLASSPPCPALPLGWSFGAFWSSQCSAGPSLRVSGCICDGPVVMPVVWKCCDGLAPVFTSPHGNKGFGPVWGSALYTMLRVLFRCHFFPALRYSPLGDPEPPSGHR